MSISEESDCPASQATLRDLMRWFGANDATLESAERVFEELVECVETSAAATPTLLAWGERLHSLSQEPETPGHEKLFMERLGYDWLRSRLMTRAVHRLGKVLADEINQGRRVRAIIDEIVKAKDCSTLMISRRAKRFVTNATRMGRTSQSTGPSSRLTSLWMRPNSTSSLRPPASATQALAANWGENGGAIAPPSAGQKRATDFAGNLHSYYVSAPPRIWGRSRLLHLF